MPKIARKMPRPMSIRLTPEAYDMLTKLSQKTGLDKVTVIDQAIRQMNARREEVKNDTL